MEDEKLILKFEEDENEFVFDKKLTIIEDKKLVKNLSKTNVSNGASSLIIKSMNNTPIYDVIQIKINVGETGVFLVNFDKEKFDEETRSKLLEKIKALKTDGEPTKDIQLKKIFDLVKILNDESPIYVSFKNTGDIKIEDKDLENITVYFPLIWLKNPENPRENKEKKPFEFNFKKIHIKLPKIDFPLWNYDYLFVALFAMLGSFALMVGIFSIFNKESIAAFTIAMGVILIGILFYVTYTTLYKKCEEKYRLLRYYLILFIVVGIVLGLVIGSIISKNVIKIKVQNLSMKKVTLIAILTSLSTLLSIPASRLINILVKRQKESAKQ